MLTDDEVRENIAANVKRLLLDRGWNQSELARRAMESHANVNRVLHARQLPGSGILARIAEAFDVSTDRLLSAPPATSAKSA